MTTRNEWAALFLSYAGWEPSAEKIDALVAQASKENAGSAWNPLATPEPAPGATDISAGVEAQVAQIQANTTALTGATTPPASSDTTPAAPSDPGTPAA